MPGKIDYSKKNQLSDISNSQYVSPGGKLSLSNPGQMELLLAMAERGAALRTTVRGFSMQPFIRDKDVLTISPLEKGQPSLGDVVAVTLPVTGRLAIHRIIGRTGTGWLIKGDNCPEPDGIISNENIIGCVCRIERNGREARLGIGKTGVIIAIVNRGSLLRRLKQILIFPTRVVSYILRFSKRCSH